MNWKKIAIAGAVALVVIGCVLAAGCTSTQTTTTTTSDPIVGSWGEIEYGGEEGIHVTTFLADGNGKEVVTFIDGTDATYPFTWKNTGEKAYQISYKDGEIWNVTYSDPEYALTWTEVKSTPDKIVGTHKSTYTNSNGKDVEFTSVFKADQTGSVTLTSENNTKENYNMTWMQIGTNKYLVISENSSRWVVTYTSDKLTYKKIDYSDEPIIGSTTDKLIRDGKSITTTNVFKENGTGVETWELGNGVKVEFPYVWDKTAENTYLVSYVDDENSPFEQWIVKYNPTNKSQDWTLFTIMWVDNYQGTDGHVVDTHLVHNDSANGIAVEYNTDGTSTTYKTQWSSDGIGSFTITYEDGETWTATWNSDTKEYDWKLISTATTTTTTSTDDAVVGVWTLPNGTTVVFGEDFNGVMITGDNETNFTWKKTTDGKYQVDSEKGDQVIWTLDNVKGTMTNAAGMVLTKQASDTSGYITGTEILLDEEKKNSKIKITEDTTTGFKTYSRDFE